MVKFKDSERDWAEFDVGSPRLGIEHIQEDDVEGKKLIGRFLGISLLVDHLELTYRELKAQGVDLPASLGNNLRAENLRTLIDPAGNILTFMG